MIEEASIQSRLAAIIRGHRLQTLTLGKRWECSCGQEMYLRTFARTGKLEQEHALHVAHEILKESSAILRARWMEGRS